MKLITYPHDTLRKKAKPINKIDNSTKDKAKAMLRMTAEYNGIGLAANQVNLLERIFVVDLSVVESPPNYQISVNNKSFITSTDYPLVVINPEIIEYDNELSAYQEGCLSIPGVYAIISRPKSLTLKFQDLENNKVILKADTLLSTCIQHEIDHLNGILYWDHLTEEERNELIIEYTQQQIKEQNNLLESSSGKT